MADQDAQTGTLVPARFKNTLAEIDAIDRDPFVSWEVVDVQFPTTPHTDYVIAHGLSPVQPKDVHYRIIKQFTPGTVYEADDARWGSDYVVLRSDVGGWTGRLLLGTLHDVETFGIGSYTTIPALSHSPSNFSVGTWTPSVKFGGGSTGLTYSSRGGNYVRVGNIYVCRASVTLSAKGSSTGAATVEGLPATASGNASVYSGLFTGFAAGVTLLSGFTVGATTTINLYNSGAGAMTQLTEASFTDTSTFILTAIYQVA